MTNLSPDFTFGAVSVLGIGLAYQAYKLFQAPSIKSIERQCTKPMRHIGDDTEVSVWGFEGEGEHKHWKEGISDDSNYVSRVEGYLRLVGLPYKKMVTNDMSENPRGKVPFANIRGTMVDDSSRIIETIKNTFNVTVDDHLTEEQKNTGYLIQQLLFGSLYWVLLHQKFETDIGREETAKDFAQKFPPVLRNLITALVFRSMHSNLYGSGIGRMCHSDIVKKGQSDVRALSKLLGNEDYFFGDKATSYDVDVYAWLVLLFYDTSQASNPWVGDIKEECLNLVAHTHRMKQKLYP